MTQRTWHRGPPPHIGWWNASKWSRGNVWRWWDGEKWSYGVLSDEPHSEVARRADLKSTTSHDVWWSDYYPENARVPRIAP